MGSPQSTSRYLLLLQVWCGILTLAMVVMAACLSVKLASQDKSNTSSPKEDYISPTDNSSVAGLNSKGPPFSYLQLTKGEDTWKEDHSILSCDSCFLALSNNSIRVNKNGLYQFYFHVTFANIEKDTKRTVFLKRNPTNNGSKKEMNLIEAVYPSLTEGSVYAEKTVCLQEGDSVRLEIDTLYLYDVEKTYWGALTLSHKQTRREQ